MIRSLITAALVLVFGLSAAGCGDMGKASTAAHRWNDAQVQQRLARGAPEDADGTYYADDKGHVEGFREEDATEKAAEDGTRAGDDLAKKARDMGDDLVRGGKDAAKSIGSAADEALDGITGSG